jgi:hypothetical protein
MEPLLLESKYHASYCTEKSPRKARISVIAVCAFAFFEFDPVKPEFYQGEGNEIRGRDSPAMNGIEQAWSMMDFGEKDAERHNKSSYYYRHPKCLRGGAPMDINGPGFFAQRAAGNPDLREKKG